MNWLNSTPSLTWGELIASITIGASLGYLLFVVVIEPLMDLMERRRREKAKEKYLEEIGLAVEKGIQDALVEFNRQMGAHAQYTPWDDDASKRGLW